MFLISFPFWSENPQLAWPTLVLSMFVLVVLVLFARRSVKEKVMRKSQNKIVGFFSSLPFVVFLVFGDLRM